ncbi:hypothetical protein HN873_072997, partial [Arachis hypogaea]
RDSNNEAPLPAVGTVSRDSTSSLAHLPFSFPHSLFRTPSPSPYLIRSNDGDVQPHR